MSAFDGIVREFNVAVDYFLPTTFKCSSFFLSHYHSDHTKGLAGWRDYFLDHLRRPGVFLYCSEITSHFLVSKTPRYSELKDKIVVMQLDAPVQIRVGRGDDDDEFVTASIIPAGHCPGSVMFLFEGRRETVLYTGDFRTSRGDLRRFRPLHHKGGAVKAISTLYLDTTFLSASYWRFPSRDQSTQTTCHVIGEWKSRGPYHHVIISLPAWTGTEYLFARVAKCFKTKIHVSRELHSILLHIPELEEVVTDDCHDTQIHAVIHKDIDGFKRQLSTYSVKIIRLSASGYKNTEFETEVEFCSGVETSYTSVCYSSHCSFSELEDVVTYLSPRKVFPCVKPFKTSKQTVADLLRRLGVQYVDLSIFSDGADYGQFDCCTALSGSMGEDVKESSRGGVALPGRTASEGTVRLAAADKLVDSPPPKRKR